MNNYLTDLNLEINTVKDGETKNFHICLRHKSLPFSFDGWLYNPEKEEVLNLIKEVHEIAYYSSIHSKAYPVCNYNCFGTTLYSPEWDKNKNLWFVNQCGTKYYEKVPYPVG